MVITRFYKQERLEATFEFLTPAFLGGADQNAELRLPPFKNLLRQWWRIVNGGLSTDELRLKEGRLFGTVNDQETDKATAMASKVRVELVESSGIAIGNSPFNIGSSRHTEVNHGAGMTVNNDLYLGFGPITIQNHNKIVRNYIKPGGKLKIAFTMPSEEVDTIRQTLALMHAFGTIGGRSRNGFGSLAVHNLPDYSLPVATEFISLVTSDKKYPHGCGRDANGLLVWEKSASKWEEAMGFLASTYMKLRLSLNIAPQGLQKRHILGYPVTHHTVGSWGGQNGRMPSQIRLMVKKNAGGEFVARIVHIPHGLPKKWDANLGSESDEIGRAHV
mgnify:FL=1